MKLTEKEAFLMEAAYRDNVRFKHPEYWRTPVDVFKGLFVEYPSATHIKTVPALRKDGSVTLLHYPLDADGVICGPPINDTNPCPPLC